MQTQRGKLFQSHQGIEPVMEAHSHHTAVVLSNIMSTRSCLAPSCVVYCSTWTTLSALPLASRSIKNVLEIS